MLAQRISEGVSGVQLFDRSHLSLSPDDFVFLFMFDFWSIVERKNPMGLITAFKETFHPKENVTLIIKSIHGEPFLELLDTLKRAAEGAQIKIINSVLTRAETEGLMELCNCYISLH